MSGDDGMHAVSAVEPWICEKCSLKDMWFAKGEVSNQSNLTDDDHKSSTYNSFVNIRTTTSPVIEHSIHIDNDTLRLQGTVFETHGPLGPSPHRDSCNNDVCIINTPTHDSNDVEIDSRPVTQEIWTWLCLYVCVYVLPRICKAFPVPCNQCLATMECMQYLRWSPGFVKSVLLKICDLRKAKSQTSRISLMMSTTKTKCISI